MRLTIVAVTDTRRGLLPRVFTLAFLQGGTLAKISGLFSVALSVTFQNRVNPFTPFRSCSEKCLPVRKHGGSRCPDFPLGPKAQR